MTAYDPAEVERLIAEAREDDQRMVPAPWTWFDDVVLWNEEADHCVLSHGGPLWPVSEEHKVGIARTRNNLTSMADQLEAAKVVIENLTGMERAARAIRLAESQGVLRQEQELEVAQAEIRKLRDERDAARAEIVRLQSEANRLHDKRWIQPWEPK